MKINISPTLSNLPTINTRNLCDIQGNLKDLTEENYERLKSSILENDFIVPLFVWFNPIDRKPHTLDGTQRLRVIRTEIPQGVELPYVEVSATDTNDAKKKILLISSQYGTTTKDGFDEFSASFDLSEFPDFEEFVHDSTTFAQFLDLVPDGEEEEEALVPDVPFSRYIDEESNYLVLKFDTHQDWVFAKSILGHLLETVASTRTNGKPWSKGIGRVLDGVEVINHLQR